MSIKVRPELVAVAQRVRAAEGANEDGTIGNVQIEAAIKRYASAAVGARWFSEEEYAGLLRLRSQAFKAPDKKLRF